MSAYSNDSNLINAYKQGKDLYATIAAIAFHNNYWDNMEHHQDGSPNIEGKARRTKMKSLVLGTMYGMGNSRMAANMGCDLREAQSIIDSFYNGFPNVKKWIEQTEKDACKLGYVEDFWGRQRRLPDLLLPPYEIEYNQNMYYNPLIGASGINIEYKTKTDKYIEALNKATSKAEKESILKSASDNGISIKDNTGFIAQAKRQCVNARIQGGAATMSKKAMISVFYDKELNDLGFKLLICVHDELIGECPEENAEKVADRLTYLMKSCVPELSVPFKCDPTIEKHWYEEDYSNMVKNTYNDIIKSMNKEDAFNKLLDMYCESTEELLRKYIS